MDQHSERWCQLETASCWIHISISMSFCSIQRPQNVPEDFSQPLFILSITHLTPGGGVPVETWLKITRHLCLWPGGHGSAVKRSKGPLIPHVKTLDLSWFNATCTILGALGKDMVWLLIRQHNKLHLCSSDTKASGFAVFLMVYSFSWSDGWVAKCLQEQTAVPFVFDLLHLDNLKSCTLYRM